MSRRSLGAVVAFVTIAATAAAQSADSDSEARVEMSAEMSVEISVTHAVVDRDGNPIVPLSVPTAFRVERMRRSGTWQTVMTYRRHTGAPTRASSHPLNGARVEFDEDSGATRVYDAAGELDPRLSGVFNDGIPAARAPGQWLEGLIATDQDRFLRSRDLTEKYGKPVSREGGLDRFLLHHNGVVEEVLADSRSALLREINTVRDGILESHLVFDYVRRADGSWIRRSMRAEQIVPGNAGHRSRTTVDFTNLSTGGK